MTYIECPQCGQKALSVATRCPRCGHNYPPQPIHRHTLGPELTRFRPLLPIVGIIVAGVVLVVMIARWATPAPSALVDTVPVVAPPPEPQSAPVAAVATDVPVVASAPAAPTSGAGMKRYARTWINVRGGRARAAPVVQVLKPGESVTVDSLTRGWYRVLTGGRPVGYVHRSNLDVTPPSQP
jgi:uncharacterized protein YgiM (DUF1202 family)